MNPLGAIVVATPTVAGKQLREPLSSWLNGIKPCIPSVKLWRQPYGAKGNITCSAVG